MRTTKVLKSIVDGIGAYLVFYLWTSLLLWLGFHLLNVIEVAYLQCLGGVMAIRQIVALIIRPTVNHIKP